MHFVEHGNGNSRRQMITALTEAKEGLDKAKDGLTELLLNVAHGRNYYYDDAAGHQQDRQAVQEAYRQLMLIEDTLLADVERRLGDLTTGRSL